MKTPPKTNIRNWVSYGMIAVVVLLCFYVIYSVKTEGYKCFSSPGTYLVDHISSSTKSPVTCSCSASGASNSILINSTGMFMETNSGYVFNISK